MKTKTITKLLSMLLCIIFSMSVVLVACDDPTSGVTITITSDKEQLTKDETATLTVVASDSGEYTLSVDKPSLVTLSGNTVKMIGDITENTDLTVTATHNSDSTVKGVKTIRLKAPAVSITITSDKEVLLKNETATLTIVVSNSGAYTLSVDKPALASLSGNAVTMIGDITVDTYLTVTATLNSDSTVTNGKTIRLKAPIVDGKVGALTSEMIKEIANPSITVSGTVTDFYKDLRQSHNNTTDIYDMTVMMQLDAWMGTWNHKDSDNTLVDSYRKGSQDNVIDAYGNVGHTLEKLFINKNNQADSMIVKNNESKPSVWEAQHMWNHLDNLNVNNFVHDIDNDVYKYKIKNSDQYLMMWLAYSLTPMLEEGFGELYLEVKDGAISKLSAQTAINYFGAETALEASAMAYTTVEISFSKIGETNIPEVTPYKAPQNVDKLSAALANMGKLNNYTFHAVDVMTSQPSSDPGDYETQSAANIRTGVSTTPDNTSAVGTVGCYGQITTDAALFATTMKYSYTMDGKDYRTEYSGYKKISDTAYDEFKFDTSTRVMTGTKRVNGIIFDRLSKFDFSPNLFEYLGNKQSGGKTLYTFALLETAVTRDIAIEVSMYKYSTSAGASSSRRLTISVDDQGHVIETMYPYSFAEGSYSGYCTTTYSNFGTTTVTAGALNGYVDRVVRNNWSQYIVNDYKVDHTGNNVPTAADVVLGGIVGTIPNGFTPQLLMEVFGDSLFGPFYNYKKNGTDASGNDKYIDSITITTQSSQYDINGRVTNYAEIIASLESKLTAIGFTRSAANSGGTSTRYVTFVNGDVQLVVENNGTKHFWLNIYKTGDWTLNR